MKAGVPNNLEIKYEIKFESPKNFIMTKGRIVRQLCAHYTEGSLTWIFHVWKGEFILTCKYG